MKAWLIHWPGYGYGVDVAETRSKARYRTYANLCDIYPRDPNILMSLRATRLPALDGLDIHEARMAFRRDYDPRTGKNRRQPKGQH